MDFDLLQNDLRFFHILLPLKSYEKFCFSIFTYGRVLPRPFCLFPSTMCLHMVCFNKQKIEALKLKFSITFNCQQYRKKQCELSIVVFSFLVITTMQLLIFLVAFLCLLPAWGGPPVLVTGGAGYIGTQICKALSEAGYLPIVYDNLSLGHADAVQWGILEVGDLVDRKKLIETLDKYHPIAVIHVAGLKAVGESVKDPAKYYLSNVCGSVILLDALREKGVDKI